MQTPNWRIERKFELARRIEKLLDGEEVSITTMSKVLGLLDEVEKESIERAIEEIKLWRPVFYKDKVEEIDIKELFEALKTLLH